MDQENLVIVGRVGTSYGVKGWVKIQSYTEPVENLLDYQPWLIKIKNEWQTVNYEDAKKHGNGLIAKLPNFETPEAVKKLANAEIAVIQEQLPTLAENDYYWKDLPGLTVVNLEGKTLGIVDHLLATGANDVVVVKGTKEYLIPFLLPQFIKEIDLTKKMMIVDWDEDF